MAELAGPLVAAGAVVTGGLITGLFTLAAQQKAAAADSRRWHREAAERNRTRFHDARVNAYVDFLAAAANAFGWLLEQARHRQGAPGNSGNLDDVRRLVEALHAQPPLPGSSLGGTEPEDHPEFNRDAARQMTRCQNAVLMLAGSPDVRRASDEVVDAVLAFAGLEPDPDVARWNSAAWAAINRYGESRRRFLETTNAELNKNVDLADEGVGPGATAGAGAPNRGPDVTGAPSREDAARSPD